MSRSGRTPASRSVDSRVSPWRLARRRPSADNERNMGKLRRLPAEKIVELELAEGTGRRSLPRRTSVMPMAWSSVTNGEFDRRVSRRLWR